MLLKRDFLVLNNTVMFTTLNSKVFEVELKSVS
jgi:hypothetical protein